MTACTKAFKYLLSIKHLIYNQIIKRLRSLFYVFDNKRIIYEIMLLKVYIHVKIYKFLKGNL